MKKEKNNIFGQVVGWTIAVFAIYSLGMLIGIYIGN